MRARKYLEAEMEFKNTFHCAEAGNKMRAEPTVGLPRTIGHMSPNGALLVSSAVITEEPGSMKFLQSPWRKSEANIIYIESAS
jgi:hypothetical protein